MNDSIEQVLNAGRFTVVRHHTKRADGTLASCSYVQHPGAVVILPMLEDGQICLIKNHRLTVGKTIIELPAGTREPGEPPIETARRELQEETGYMTERLEPLATFYTSPGIVDEQMHAFVASSLTAGTPAREANEQIENLIVAWETAMSMVTRGEIEDGKTLVTLLMYARKMDHSP